MTKEQKKAIQCVLEQLTLTFVSVEWAMKKIEGILKGEIAMKPDAKMPSEDFKELLAFMDAPPNFFDED